jgi:hypothetical protein
VRVRSTRCDSAGGRGRGKGGGGGAGNAQFAGYRGAGRFSAPHGETLLLLPPQPIKHYTASARAKGTAEGWWVDAKYVVRGNTTQTVLNKEI